MAIDLLESDMEHAILIAKVLSNRSAAYLVSLFQHQPFIYMYFKNLVFRKIQFGFEGCREVH
jgi:hypothetical protein